METQDNRIRVEKASEGSYYIAEILVQSSPSGDTWEILGYFTDASRALKSAKEALDG